MNWLNLSIIVFGGATLAFVTYTSIKINMPEEEKPGVLHSGLEMVGLGFLTTKGSPLYEVDRGLKSFYRDIGSYVSNFGSSFTAGYAGNYFDNPVVLPLGIFLVSLLGGIVFFT